MSDWLHETKACEQLGISRQTSKRLRDDRTLIEGIHWKKEADGIQIGRIGMGKLAEVLGLSDAECTAMVKWEPLQCPVQIIRMTKNSRIVLAEPRPPEGIVLSDFVTDGGRMRVRVPNSHKLCLGLMLEAEHVREDLWEAIGRMPRSKREAARQAMKV